jgi:mannonate dehydratase
MGVCSDCSMDWAEYDNSPVDDDRAGTTVDQIFERIKYFLERVVPVAEHFKVQLACHLDDPPSPPLKGVARWDYPVFEGCKRFVELVDSPYNGLNFCCGTASEGLDDPKTELIPIVKYLTERKKVFNIHFRNIVGNLRNFSEVWPDEGDVDMFEVRFRA